MPKMKIERSEAILRKKRNTRKGLLMRNIILKFLYEYKQKRFTIAEIAENNGLTYSAVSYHLKSMLEEKVVTREIMERRSLWQITGLGQQTIKKWLEKSTEKS